VRGPHSEASRRAAAERDRSHIWLMSSRRPIV
jgi:hypothetical protein